MEDQFQVQELANHFLEFVSKKKKKIQEDRASLSRHAETKSTHN